MLKEFFWKKSVVFLWAKKGFEKDGSAAG